MNIKHDETLLAQLYWDFNNERLRSGDEESKFKAKLRLYATKLLKDHIKNEEKK